MGKKKDATTYALIEKSGIIAPRRSGSAAAIDQGLQDAAPLALKYLVLLVKDDTASHRQRLEAAKTLLDRAGYPARAASGDGVKDLKELSTAELTEMLQEIHSLKVQRSTPVIEHQEPECSLLE